MGKTPKNFVSLPNSMSGDRKCYYNDSYDKQFSHDQKTLKSDHENLWIAQVMSGMSIQQPTGTNIISRFNNPKFVDFGDGIPKFKFKIKIISNIILGGGSVSPSSGCPDPIESGISYGVAERRTSISPFEAYTDDTNNWIPIFGSIVIVREVSRGVFYLESIVRDVAPDLNFTAAAAKLYNLPWNYNPGQLEEAENLCTETLSSVSQAAGYTVMPKYRFLKFPLAKKVIVTSNYGMRLHPVLGVMRLHSGIDLGAPTGTAVYAASNGQVTKITGNATDTSGYGLRMIIEHDSNYTTLYSHLNATIAKVGDEVKIGQKVAEVGASGIVTGAHLHYEIKFKGKKLDPRFHPCLSLISGQKDPTV